MVHGHSNTVSQQVQAVSDLLAHEGRYGVVSQLSRSQQVSRQTLYSWKQKGHRALEAAFMASKPQVQGNEPVDLQRAVLTLLVEGHASYRGIQTCLAVLLGQHVSLGTITAIVQTAGERAQAWLEQQVSEQGRVLALDEQYSSKRGEAYLNVVDVHSGQVWASLPPAAVEGESWMIALWDLQAQGVTYDVTVSDGGNAIHEALKELGQLWQHQRDVWHLFHLAATIQGRVETAVEQEEHRLHTIRGYEERKVRGERFSGRPPKTTLAMQEHLVSHLLNVWEAVAYLFQQFQQLLDVVII